ncbi:DUF4158 domain-containing protein [Actinopolyspora lacussalsi]|uniref:DUF4158 domain-containing protein n=1 Tax=Actinopolyspora righensis TaxID=995060 RepID=UPI001587CAEA
MRRSPGCYSCRPRSIKDHRAQIRAAFSFREFSRGDEDKLAGWLAEEVCPVELREDRLRQVALARCRAEGIEPPGRVGPPHRFGLFDVRAAAFPPHCRASIGDECGRTGDLGRRVRLRGAGSVGGVEGRSWSGRVGDGAGRGRQADGGAPAGAAERAVRRLFEKLVAAWRARAMRSYPSDLRDSAPARFV